MNSETKVFEKVEMDYDKIQPIVEVYRCIQSEGSLTGIPHIALRTTGCTHRCYFGEGGWCDSWYTSIHPDKGTFTLKDIRTYFEENMDITHLMFTGGSPTMHTKLCNEIVRLFKETHYNNKTYGHVTIETEGSHFVDTDHLIDLISLSPKFSNSVPKLGIETPGGKIVDEKFIKQHNKFRLNYEAIENMLRTHLNYQFKPVWDGTEETLQEIEDFRKKMHIPKHKTWIMPAGSTREELIKIYPKVMDMCTEKGYNFTGREHIIAYDDRREV